ncbi:MAG: TonB-dependent receptor [Chitinophagaceae bacterium]|nr:TonB-dependent receptor [Chitinophagaceae bacterium]
MLRTVITLTCVLMLYCTINAQDVQAVRITCQDSSGKYLSKVVAYLYTKKDLVLTRTGVTGDKGVFTFNSLSAGSYLIAASFNDLRSDTLKIEIPSKDTSFSIVLLPRISTLSGVTVRNKSELVQARDNKLIFTVPEMLAKAGANSLDVLAKAPGVSVKGDNISLFGQSNLLIKLNGKEAFGTRDEAITYLRSLPPGTIQSVEIIASPGAEYENKYAGGVINVITRKDEKQGARVSITTSNSWGEYYRGLVASSVTYRKKALSLATVLTMAHNNFYENNRQDQFLQTNAGIQQINQRMRSVITANDFQGRISGDYSFSRTTNLGFNFSTVQADRDGDINNTNAYSIAPAYQRDSLIRLRESRNAGIERYFGNINFTHLLDSSRKKITVDLNTLTDNVRNHSSFLHTYTDQNENPIRVPLDLNAFIPGKITISNLRAEYSAPVKPGYSMLWGTKLVRSEIENNVRYDSIVNNQVKPDIYRTSYNVFTEKIAAFYGSISHSGKVWGWEAGLRYEAASVSGVSRKDQTSFERDFGGLLPNLRVSYRINKTNQLSFSAKRSVVRPDYQKLNPFIQYVTPNFYIQGNPNLRQYNAYLGQLIYTLKGKYVFTLRYDYAKDYVPQTAWVRDSISPTVIRQTYDNIASGGGVQLSAYLPFSISKWWNTTVSINAFSLYAKPEKAGYEGFSYHTNNANISIVNILQLPFGLFGQVQFDASTPFRVNQNELKTAYSLDFYIRKAFLNNRLSFGISGKDLAYRDIRRGTAFFDGGYSSFYEKKDTRRFGIDIQFLFGRTKLATLQKKNTGIEDEENRIKK